MLFVKHFYKNINESKIYESIKVNNKDSFVIEKTVLNEVSADYVDYIGTFYNLDSDELEYEVDSYDSKEPDKNTYIEQILTVYKIPYQLIYDNLDDDYKEDWDEEYSIMSDVELFNVLYEKLEYEDDLDVLEEYVIKEEINDLKDLKEVNYDVDKYILDLFEILNKHYNGNRRYKFDQYTNLYINSKGNISLIPNYDFDDNEIKVRIANHTHNPRNDVRFGTNDVTIVITNVDKTKNKFFTASTDLKFDTDDNIKKVSKEIIKYIQMYFKKKT